MANGSGSGGQTLERLKRVAEIVGVVAGMGAAFTGLAFGIGYVATKHHDDMFGVPTTTTDNTTYVRTGALFFTQSLHDLVDVVAATVDNVVPGWRTTLLLAIAVLLGIWLWRRLAKQPMLASLIASRPRLPRDAEWLAICAGFVLLFTASARYLPSYVAPLDMGNKGLLFGTRPVTGRAAQVNQKLRGIEQARDSVPGMGAEQQLHRLYGSQWAIVLGLALGVVGLHRWRRSLDPAMAPTGSAAVVVGVVDRVIRPVTYVIVVVLVVATPANYGVLAMSTSLPCVQLHTLKTGQVRPLGEPGYLLSDLSSEKAKVAILRWDTDTRNYFVDFHPRDSLHQIQVWKCPVRNPINRIAGP